MSEMHHIFLSTLCTYNLYVVYWRRQVEFVPSNNKLLYTGLWEQPNNLWLILSHVKLHLKNCWTITQQWVLNCTPTTAKNYRRTIKQLLLSEGGLTRVKLISSWAILTPRLKDRVPLRVLSCSPQQYKLNHYLALCKVFWAFCCFDFWGPGFITIILKCMLLFSCRFLLENSPSLFSQDVDDFSQNNDTRVFTGTSGTHLLNDLTCVCDHLWYRTLWEWFSSDAFGCSGRFYLKGTHHQRTPSSFGYYVKKEELRCGGTPTSAPRWAQEQVTLVDALVFTCAATCSAFISSALELN